MRKTLSITIIILTTFVVEAQDKVWKNSISFYNNQNDIAYIDLGNVNCTANIEVTIWGIWSYGSSYGKITKNFSFRNAANHSSLQPYYSDVTSVSGPIVDCYYLGEMEIYDNDKVRIPIMKRSVYNGTLLTIEIKIYSHYAEKIYSSIKLTKSTSEITSKKNYVSFSNKNIGIGTNNPAKRLHIKSSDKYSQMVIEGASSAGLHLRNTNSDIRPVLCGNQKDFSIQFWKSDNAWKSTPFRILENGNVGIGKTPTNYKLDVNGTIRANEIIVSNPSTADFVFEKNYKLKSLAEVEKFITKNKHLPDVASAKEMKANGVKQGEMNAKLLQKIEELTLYIIQLKKENKELKESNKKIIETLNKRIQKLENKQ